MGSILSYLVLLLCVFSLAQADIKEINLSPSRSGEIVDLEEDFKESYTTYETRYVDQYGCAPEPVSRRVCRTLPPRNVCGPRSFCHPSPYGPVCQTRIVCGPVSGGQYCENVRVVENVCRTRRRAVQVPITRERTLYTTQAEVEVELSEDFPNRNFLMKLELTQDELKYSATDKEVEYALFYEVQESRSPERGRIEESILVRAEHSVDYLHPVSQIPAFFNYDGRKLYFQVAENIDSTKILLRIRAFNQYNHLVENYVPNHLYDLHRDQLSIDLRGVTGPYFYPVRGEVILSLRKDPKLLNADQFSNLEVKGYFSL